MNNLRMLKYIQLLNIVLIAIFLMEMLTMVNHMQDASRVINYVGIVRGSTQRLIKLELAHQPKQQLVVQIDMIMDGLLNGSNAYQISKLKDEEYLASLKELNDHWQLIRREIYQTRIFGNRQSGLMDMSEQYFTLADNTAGLAELYIDNLAENIRYMAVVLAILLLGLAGNLYWQSLIKAVVRRP